MRTLTIGSTTVVATSCTRMRNNQRGFYLDIKIPKGNISMDELYALLDGNTEPITVAGEDGTESIYRGFREIGGFSVENGMYHIAQYCTSEIEAQLSIAQNKVTAQAAALEATNKVVEAQTIQINAQNKVINQQTEIIKSQGDTLTAQQTTINQLENANAELKAAQETNDAELLYQICLLQLGVTEDEL